MSDNAVDWIRERPAEPASARPGETDVDVALERARRQVEGLAATTAELESSLPGRVAEAVRAGVRTEASPVARQLAEVRGLASQTIRRLERIEADLTAERHSRVDDLGLLVDLVASSWSNVEKRLESIERSLEALDNSASVHPIAEAS